MMKTTNSVILKMEERRDMKWDAFGPGDDDGGFGTEDTGLCWD